MSSSSDSNPGPIALTSDDDRAASSRRRQPINRFWIFHDEVKILTALAAERRDAGVLPTSSALLEVLLRQGLHRENPTAVDVSKKVGSLRQRFRRVIASGGPKVGLRHKRLYDLSAEVWPELLQPQASSSSTSSPSSAARHSE